MRHCRFARFPQLDFGWELVSKDALEEGASPISCASQQEQEWRCGTETSARKCRGLRINSLLPSDSALNFSEVSLHSPPILFLLHHPLGVFRLLFQGWSWGSTQGREKSPFM